MAFTKKNRIILIVGIAIAAGLGLSSAIISNNYEKNRQEVYTRCIEKSAGILIHDGNTPPNEILNVAKESCQGYGEPKEKPGEMLAAIAILIVFITFLLFTVTLSY